MSSKTPDLPLHDVFGLTPQTAGRVLRTLLRICQEGIAVTGPDARIEMVNPAFTAITGYTADEVLGQPMNILKSDRHDEAFYNAMWRRLGETGHWEGEIWNRRKNGEAYPEWLTIASIHNDNGAVINYLGVFSDLTGLKRSQDIIHQHTYQDSLTSLPNRHLFLDRLSVALRQTLTEGTALAVICLDLDRFKLINDSLGHVAGDVILSEVGARLATLMRQADTLSRFSGDAFSMLLADLRDPEDAAHVAGRVLTSLAAPFTVHDQEVYISASLGITIAPTDGTIPAQLLQNAEMAMYRAKEAGRNNFHFFTEDLGNRVLGRLRMENDLRKALAKSEFVLHYQPKVNLTTGQVTGMEALVRWVSPSGRMVPPVEFIPLAEETGLILPLGEWILEEACRATRRLNASRLNPLKVAVNFSPRQLEQPGLTAKVLEILARTGLPSSQLEVEITESVFLSGFETAKTILTALSEQGISVALDDFGTGYSSLTYLKRLPISTLKIDKSFIDGLPDDRDDAAIVSSVISIAANLGLEIVAEGVESLVQLDFLRARNCCGGFQGYLFSKPLPELEFAALLERGACWTVEMMRP